MASSKKIVIKINRSGDHERKASKSSAPSEITVWNIKRIVFALILAILLIVIPYFFLGDGLDNSKEEEVEQLAPEQIDEQSTIPKQEQPPLTTEGIKPEASAVSKVFEPSLVDKRFKTITHYKVPRGLLTDAINNKEPVNELKPPFRFGETKGLKLYYFTEIRDMQNQSLYHQWIKDGVVVQKTLINPQGKRWRVSSSVTLKSTDTGRWIVQLLDSKGLIYNELIFSVVED